MAQLVAPANKLTERDDGRNAAYCRVVTASGSHSERRAGKRWAALRRDYEGRIAAHSATWLEAFGGKVESEGVYPGRPNTYGVRRGQTDRWIAVDVHVGTVGVETMIDSTSPGETPRPHPEAAVTAGIKVDSARPPATEIDLSTTPHASKNSVRKTVAKSGKATAGAAAEAPKQPLSPVQPEKTVKLPTAQAATDLVAAAPTTPTTFAAQSVGQLTHALVYLTHFPVALIQHATDPNTEGQ
jgi:hypothetical protein